MTERHDDSAVEALRSRLGTRHQSGIDAGKADMARVLREELNIGADEADDLLRQMIEAGTVRYVTGSERDPEVRDGDGAEHTGMRAEDSAAARGDALGLNVVPPTGGPQAGYSGMATGTATPAVAVGTGSPAAGAMAMAATDGAMAEGGYWEIGAGGATGVVPSSTRKGQVEPRGT